MYLWHYNRYCRTATDVAALQQKSKAVSSCSWQCNTRCGAATEKQRYFALLAVMPRSNANTCTDAHTCTHMHTHTHTRTHLYTHGHTCTTLLKCMCTRTRIQQTCAHIHAHILSPSLSLSHTHTNAHTHINTHTHTHTYTRTYTHTYTHIHTYARPLSLMHTTT